jgi:hypothetical protein
MSVLFIGPDERRRIAEIVAHAREHYAPWSALHEAALPKHDAFVLKLEDRNPGTERPQPMHIDLGTFTAAFSFEEQPAGICRHLSVSTATVGKLPNELVVKMCCEAFGFTRWPPEKGKIWLEEFRPGEFAVNVLEVAEPYGQA